MADKCDMCNGTKRIWSNNSDDQHFPIICPRCRGSAERQCVTDPLGHHIITVHRKGTKDIVFQRGLGCTAKEAERAAGEVWNRFCTDDRYRLTVRKEGDKRLLLTIG